MPPTDASAIPPMRAPWQGVWLGVLLWPVLAHAELPLCEYSSYAISPTDGLIAYQPHKVTATDCLENGAALSDLDPGWRQRLPERVRWLQKDNAVQLCQQALTTLGQRQAVLSDQACVFLQEKECTIVSSAALSHGQLANGVRSCVP